MTDAALMELADAAGVAPRWRDVHGGWHDVAPDTLRAVLRGIGVAADSDTDVRASREQVRHRPDALAPLMTVPSGHPLRVPGRWRATLETGGEVEGTDTLRLTTPGYHHVAVGGHDIVVAVAPPRCHDVPPGRPWGLAAQLYALRRDGDGGIGDFAGLADFARAAARRGADAVAISPVHAQFSADPHRFSPYAPSSRIMLNVLHAPPPRGRRDLEAAGLVDWTGAARHRLAELRLAFAADHDAAGLASFRAERGAPLEAHARFEALHAHFYARDQRRWHWRAWPDAFRDPASPAVAAFAHEQAGEVAFHAWLQMRADRALAAAQAAARDGGMRIGLIADLAVGADSGGSQAWSRQAEMLDGLSVGAPPDLLNTRGQDWGLTTFSPHGLRGHGFAAFIDMLRAALRHAGGIRIDHAMGLQRLWLVPHGADASQGAYVTYPHADLLRLVALESCRHRAIVVAEDLGTVAEGFQVSLDAAGILGMRVLWFEHDGDGYQAPRDWSPQAAAMTSTHDLATAAGWWQGRDIDWRARIGLVTDVPAARRERAQERIRLWQAMRDSGAAEPDAAPPDRADQFATAAVAHVAGAACKLALLPVEDVLAVTEQPNLPSTIDEHPNWRRRLDGPASTLLDRPDAAARIAAIAAARTRPETG
jgi:4-alpha-glucanotransferase